MKSRFIVDGLGGEKRLEGEVAVRGAKNAVLKGLAASLLFEDTVRIENAPGIEDVERMGEILRGSGASIVRGKGEIEIGQPQLWQPELAHDIAQRLRASIVLTGPMLARAGEVVFPFPGGCVLGERPIDLFLAGFRAMGASIEERGDLFHVRAKNGKLSGARIFFPIVSVTATETLMLAAVLAEGQTVLLNAAMEPEIKALAEFLNACGAQITGAGTPTIRIEGGELLRANGKAFVTPPDRIEAGSFVLLGALAGKEVIVRKCEPQNMDALLSLLARSGVPLEIGGDFVAVRGAGMRNEEFKSVSVRTHEYPGFPTDLQAPMAVYLTQTSGEATILETIFDGRFRYTDDLIRMGADITVMNPHRIMIRGPRRLTRKELEGPDLRAGLAYMLAATVAEGTSIIDNVYVIDRGYEKIEERLRPLGLSIRRETE